MQIDYTATRSIQAGHAADTAYTINIDLSANKRSVKIDGSDNRSIDNSQVVVINYVDIKNDLSTVLVSASTTTTILDMREFLDSVIAGEVFQTDLSGSLVDYKLDSIASPYSENELERSNFRYSFVVRTV